MYDDDRQLPYPFDEDEYQDESKTWYEWLRPFIFVVGIVVTIVMLALPLLRAIDLYRATDDGPSIEQRLRQNAAIIFSQSVLERRSAERAMQITDNDLRADVISIVTALDHRDQAEIRGADLTISRIGCFGLGDLAEECFETELVRNSAIVYASIRFGVALVNGQARIVSIKRTGRML